MKDGFYSKKSAFGLPNALILLMLIFFFVPFGARGARMALQKTENNVKDWLPSDFRETEELAWFAKRFVSEQFVVATWEGCQEGDQRLKLFESKLRNEQALSEETDRDSDLFRARQIGHDYALFLGNNVAQDWGGKNEKWLIDENGKSYFITPNGRLYRWDGSANIVGATWRALARAIGSFSLEGQFVAAFGNPGTDEEPNPFWADPRLLTAPLFKTIETGPQVVEQLAGKDGSLYTASQPVAGQRDAISRLTGTLFGPVVPTGFGWKSEDIVNVLSEKKLAELPEGWESVWNLVVQYEVDEKYDGDLEAFRAADPVNQETVWYQFFDTVGVSEPPRQTCVVLTLTDPARRNLAHVVGRGMLGKPRGRLFEIGEECGISAPLEPSTAPPPFSWIAANQPVVEPAMHIGGPPVDNVAIDEEGTITLVRLIGYSLALGLGLSYLLLRSMRLMMMVFFVGGVSAMASLSLVWWCNASIDAILLTMPSLVYVLGMAGAIHIVNYYRDAVAEHGEEGAPERAIAHAVMPCSLAAVTTAIGLLSLCSSNILPIRKFGIFSAMGVIATLVLLYLYLPSALTIFPPKKPRSDSAASGTNKAILRFWEGMGGFILRNHWWVNAACITAFILIGAGLFRIKTSVQLLKLFDSQSQIIKDYGWLEENFGRLVPMELVVRFPESLQRQAEADSSFTNEDRKLARAQLSLLERAEAVARIQTVLQNQFGYEGEDIVGRGMSATTFLPTMPDPSKGFSANRTAVDRMLQKSRDKLLESDYLDIEDTEGAEGTELWRISLRLGALNDVDYGQFVSSLRSVVEPVVASYRCRHSVIESITDHRNQSDDRLIGQVLVLGGAAPTANIEALTDLAHSGHSELDIRRQIFAASLKACLTNETIGSLRWHDPDAATAEPRSQAWWAERLAKFDCIVLMKSHPTYDLDFIKQYVPNVVDAESMLAAINPATLYSQQPISKPVALTTYDGEMDVVYTGVVPVVYKAQRTLLISLIESVTWAFVLIAFVMACLLSPARTIYQAFKPVNLLQAIGAGAVSMIPNVFPVVVVFGIMGHQGTLVDIGSMMTASVAMGVAVDDTIHFLTWFRDGLRKGLDRRDALFVAYKHVAPAMTQTTIIGGLGLSVFALSTFTPTQRFGTLMLSLLGAALVGDLIFLPALLASPLGRIFTVRPDKKAKTNKSDPTDSTTPSSESTPSSAVAQQSEVLGGNNPLSRHGVHPPHMLRRDPSQVRRRI